MNGKIEPYVISDKQEAEFYLKDLLKDPKNRHIDEVTLRANRLIKDREIRDYFISEAKKELDMK